jgi:hypothetical protein
MFNEPRAPRGFFDWSVFGEAFELVKTGVAPFMAFTLLGTILVYMLSQLVSAPATIMSFTYSGDLSKMGDLMKFSMIFSIFSNIIMMGAIGIIKAGQMAMAKSAIANRIPDIPEGFGVIKQGLRYGLANAIPYIAIAPILLIAAVAFGDSFSGIFNILNNPGKEPDAATIDRFMSIITTSLGYSLGWAILLLIISPFFILAVPAAFVERNLPTKEAILKAFHLGKANYFNLLAFSFVSGASIYFSMFCCCIPALFVHPWMVVALLLIYRDVAGIPLTETLQSQNISNYPREHGASLPGLEVPKPPPPQS